MLTWDKELPFCVSFTRCPQWPGAETQQGNISSGLPHEQKEPNHLDHYPCLPVFLESSCRPQYMLSYGKIFSISLDLQTLEDWFYLCENQRISYLLIHSPNDNGWGLARLRQELLPCLPCRQHGPKYLRHLALLQAIIRELD